MSELAEKDRSRIPLVYRLATVSISLPGSKRSACIGFGLVGLDKLS